MKITILVALLFCTVAFAKPHKGKGKPNPEIVNPDTDEGAENPPDSPEYNSELTEGDIGTKDGKKLNKEDRNAVKDKSKLWPQGQVPYVIDGSISSSMKAKFEEAVADYEKYTCVRFVPRKDEADYVFVNSQKQGCYAWLGRVGGQQPLNLQDPGCKYKGTIIHEMLHTIGFGHEQARNDRDQYITVNWGNIQTDARDQFAKMEEEDNMGFGYDFSSVMHYGDDGFSSNGGKTITTKDPSKQDVIGQRQGFSKQDIEEVKTLYKCSGSTSGVGGKNGCSNKASTADCESMLSQHGKAVCDPSAGNIGEMCQYTCGSCE